MPTESRFAPTNGASAPVATELANVERNGVSFHADFIDGPEAIAQRRNPEAPVAVGTGGYPTDVPVNDHEKGRTATPFTTVSALALSKRDPY